MFRFLARPRAARAFFRDPVRPNPVFEVLTMTGSPLRRRRALPVVIAGAMLLCTAGAPGAQEKKPEAAKPDAPKSEGPKSPLYVHVETRNTLNYAGDANEVTILFQNDSKENWTNPGIEIESGFQVSDSEGKKLEKTKAPTSLKEAQPKVLEPKGYFGKIIDLNTLFPKMKEIGTYKITWSAAGLPEKTIMARVIKKYDPARDYQAVLDTEFGNIVLDFYKDLAPSHVKNFIDLANQGYYDQKIVHRIIKGEAIFGGSRTGDERGGPGYTLPPEPNGLKILAGSVAQVRNSYTGAEESGSIFMVAAVPQPEMDDRYTVFARVTQGLETVKTISNLPTAGGAGGRVAARPVRDVVIKKIEIREKKSDKPPAKAS
jgi:cyclophilin family peptidyl-prolyl cis-trans isomerase